jgi:hypothetical protein
MMFFGQRYLTGWVVVILDSRPWWTVLEHFQSLMEMAMPLMKKLPVLEPTRRRQTPDSFAWIDHRLRANGWLERLQPADLGLYLFLLLAADRDGLSCWRLDRIERAVPCFDRHELWDARERLLQYDLIAYRPWSPHSVDGCYQVLSLPPANPR